MAITLDISDDFAIFDNTEAATLILRRNAGDTGVSIPNSLRGAMSTIEPARLGVATLTHDLSIFLPADEVGATAPEPGDSITIVVTVYWIHQVRRVELGSSLSGYICTVKPEAY